MDEQGRDQDGDCVSGHHESQIFSTNTTLLLNILTEINLGLGMFARAGLYQNDSLSEPVTSISTDLNHLNEGYSALLKRVSVVPQKAPESLGVFRSFTWSAFRKTECETILQGLARCNDLLHDLLNDQQRRSFQKQQRNHNIELIQTRDSLSEIQNLLQATAASKNAHSHSGKWQRAIDEELENLASFKALYMSLLRDNEVESHNIKIEASRIQMKRGEQREHPQAIYISSSNEEQRVWINWQKNGTSGDLPAPNSISPTEELAILLRTSKPDEFCTPVCLGYSILQRDETSLCPALIFKCPADFDFENQPRALFRAFTTYEKPSLPQRVMLAHKLAQGLLYLHSVNWLHKALRSSNILFFAPSTSDLNIRSPIITGFDNSRRSRFNETTNEVPRAGHMEVYRHPDTQRGGLMLPYRKTFDIYSLGLVLAEIALWRPLVSIMGIETTVDQSPRFASSIQERWLASEPKLLRSLRADVGEKYAEAVETCLKGRIAFDVEQRDAETSTDTGMKIQRGFNAKVVRPLAEIVV